MAQQTAVEWLVEQLINNENIRWRGAPVSELREQAKAMEKGQVINAAKKFANTLGVEDEDIEQYYNETYNK